MPNTCTKAGCFYQEHHQQAITDKMICNVQSRGHLSGQKAAKPITTVVEGHAHTCYPCSVKTTFFCA